MKSEVWGLKAEVWGLSSYENLSPCAPCVPWIFGGLLRKKYFRKITILLDRFLGRLGPQILHEDFLQDFLRKQHET